MAELFCTVHRSDTKLLPMKVDVVPHSPRWRYNFQEESLWIRSMFSPSLVGIHHIGSTAIPGIYAKPVIDILVEVTDITAIDKKNAHMEKLDYEAMGEYGISGRRYFRKNDAGGHRTHQVHVFQTGSPDVERHLAFRDYMITHPVRARAYSDLKRKIAAECGDDIEKYMEEKDMFVKEAELDALAWCQSKSLP